MIDSVFGLRVRCSGMRRHPRAKAEQIQYDAQRMAEDVALKGWHKRDFARRSKVSDMTVIRFLRGERQTAKAAFALSKALGYTPERYLISQSKRVA